MLTKNGKPLVQLETQLIMHASKMLITVTNKHHVLRYKENPFFFLHDIIYYESNSVNFKKIMYDGCQSDRLCGLVVRVSGYRYRGLGFDSRRYKIF